MPVAVSPYPHLFEPLRLGPLTLRNRLLLSPMTTGFGFFNGAPDERILEYFTARSRDVALAVVAFGAVRPEGMVEQRIPWMWRPDAGLVLRPLAAAIARAGALPCLQLGHGGRQVSPRVIGEPPVAPSPLPPAAHVNVPPRALPTDEVQQVVAAFAQAAVAARQAGFAAVEIHAGHGYLVQQFLSAQSNRRDDRYGGNTVAERARFGVEVVTAVRAAVPELAVLVRVNGDDLAPGGLTPADCAAAAALFAAAGADGIVVSAGVYGSVPYTIPLLDDPEATFLDAAAFVRRSVEVPVVAVGRFTLPAAAEAALASGACDAVALGRALLADPSWVSKAAAGRPAEIRPCIATVQGCAGMLQHGGEISCSVNPDVGRETVPAPVADRPAAVAVVGGGVSGMEAALRAAELGHRVVLHERDRVLGGALRLAAKTPGMAHVRRLLTWYERQLERAGVTVRLSSAPAVEALASVDLVVVAVGAETVVPLADGFDTLPGWTLEDLMAGRDSTLGDVPLPGRLLVLGGGQRGLAAALWLTAAGAEPVLLDERGFGHDTSGLARRAYQHRLQRRGAQFLNGRLQRLDHDGAWITDGAGRPGHVAVGGVVACEPVRARRWPPAPAAAPAVKVGDAMTPVGIGPAIAGARDAVDAFTRERNLKSAG